MNWMILPFKRYFEFSGRSRRKEFWMFQLLQVLVSFVLFAIMFSGGGAQFLAGVENENLDATVMGVPMMIGGILAILWFLAAFIPSLAVTIRRLHDRNLSGWWYGGLLIASFIPILNIFAGIGMLVMLVILMLDGTDGPNRFGPDPKDPSQAEVFA